MRVIARSEQWASDKTIIRNYLSLMFVRKGELENVDTLLEHAVYSGGGLRRLFSTYYGAKLKLCVMNSGL